MSDGSPDGAIRRLLSEVTVSVAQQTRGHDKRLRGNALKEIEQQFQVQISGKAGGLPGFAPVTINFPYAFHFAPGQRESTLEFPHFTYGSHTKPPVGVVATVEEWLRGETGAITGAVVQIAALGEVEFAGWAHLSFQGYSALTSNEG